MKKLLLFSTLFLFAASGASGQILQETRTEAMKSAGLAGKIAGGAYFCKLKEDDLDTFISLANAQIARLAIDKVDKIVAQLEFSNNYSLWAGKEPEEGCKRFKEAFYEKFNKATK